MPKHNFEQNGFTIIEILIVLAIVALLSVVSFQSFGRINGSEAINKDAFQIISVLRQARSLTLDSKNGNQYGVHLESSRVVLFEGSSYDPNSTNNTIVSLSNRVTISSISLSGGGSDVVFEKVTGKTAKSGTVVISLINDNTQTKTITIYGTGLAEFNQ
ncbi:MAG TPA: prepilin-type N-terminal cleavage/methylation domain-containing protein [Candidatus Paceibacterota bacterium]